MKRCLVRDVEDGYYRPVRFRPNQVIAALLSVTFITLFIGFHISLYDNTIYQMQLAQQIPSDLNQDFIFVDEYASSATINDSQGNTAKRKDHFSKTRRRLPQALIIGVRKCGTRALLEMLFLHPRIQKAAGEVHFFDRDDNYNLGLDWYRQKMPYSFADQVTIEKSPSYFVTPEVPERIRAMNASVRLLLILREPVTRAISDYTQLKSHAASTTPITKYSVQKSFEELAIKPDGEVNASYRPIAISIYHTYMLQWLEVFPRNQMLIVSGDRLIEDPISEVQKIESFLGLESKITRDNFYFNQTKGFYCLKINGSERCLRESKGRKHPRVDPLVVSKLRKFFNDHNQRLYELIGEELGWPEN
ncbi:heparan sulfate glucosamine 3-O-sulfotransferase 1 [Planococcus citri]|uniref:heparan sulfate glucosamine 3-O-sulfotransferase 1 n=1 Tax=Planococcus citri TaxID=170843 RepID=UPI0031F83E2F